MSAFCICYIRFVADNSTAVCFIVYCSFVTVWVEAETLVVIALRYTIKCILKTLFVIATSIDRCNIQ